MSPLLSVQSRTKYKLLIFISNICSGVAAVFEASSERKVKLLCFSFTVSYERLCRCESIKMPTGGSRWGIQRFWSLLHR